MRKQQLIIEGQEVELLQNLPVSLTYQIANLSEPDKVKSDTSKTITIPASKKVNKLFSQIFDVNIDLNTGATFNPNVKAPSKYYVNDVRQFDGVVQLKAVRTKLGQPSEYDVVLFGRNANVFFDIGDALLGDLDLSRFDHNWTQANQSDSWATQIQENAAPVPFALGNGYVYPMIDYGFDSDLSNFAVTELFPAFYAKTYLDQILDEAGGYTYTSNFLNSDNFKRLIVPFNRSAIELTAAEQASRVWDVEGLTPFTDDLRLKNPGSNPSFTINQFELTTTINDPSGAVNLTPINNVEIQVGKSGFYDVFGLLDISGEFIPDNAGSTYNSNCYIAIDGFVTVNGGTVAGFNGRLEYNGSIVTSATTARPATPPDDDYLFASTAFNFNNPANEYPFSQGSVFLNAGDTVAIKVQANILLIDNSAGRKEFIKTAGGGPTNEGGIVRFTVHRVKLFSQINNPALSEGDLITHDTIIPRDIKQRDFFKAIIQMHNLYIEPDKDNPKMLTIEPRDDFFTSDKVDWSAKLDNSQDLTVKPLGALDANEFLYTYKGDKDFYNALYEDSNLEVYGQRKFTTANEFYNVEKKNEIIFSPTPLVGSDLNDRVIPRIFKLDGTNNPEPADHNIRILYYAGLLNTSQVWQHTSSIDPTDDYLTYPYAGHLDNPHASTYDINFGLPIEVFFNPTQPLTVNGLVNTYYLNTLNQITDVNSKVVEGMFYLTPLDIEQLNFNARYWFANSYWRLQKVDNYQPNLDNLTKCTFIKEL